MLLQRPMCQRLGSQFGAIWGWGNLGEVEPTGRSSGVRENVLKRDIGRLISPSSVLPVHDRSRKGKIERGSDGWSRKGSMCGMKIGRNTGRGRKVHMGAGDRGGEMGDEDISEWV